MHRLAAVVAAVGITMTVAACSSDEAPRAEGKPYHHLADGTFRNPPGSPSSTAGFSDYLPFMFRRIASRADDVQIPEGHAVPQDQALANLTAMAGQDSVTWLGHASFLLHMADMWVLTDPYLGEVAGPAGFGPRRYVAPGIPLDRLPKIDVLIISHNHYDHLDAETIEALPNKERMYVFVPLKLGEFFRSRGYRQVFELDWYAGVVHGDLTITALPAVHFSRRGPFDRNATLWAGFSLDDGNSRVYFAGDTAYGQVFEEIGKRVGPFDLGLIPIGAYLPQSIMKASHVTPEEAVRLADDVGAARVIGMHWGTVTLTDEDRFEPPARYRAAAEAAGWTPGRAGLMAIGETRPLSAPDS
ncbi:MAG: MBL fold metallo-hydrolase [Alphaproteobacteria bacterium]